MNDRRGRELPEHVKTQIRRLRRDGRSIREIAELAGVSKKTVEKYVSDLPNPREDPPLGVDVSSPLESAVVPSEDFGEGYDDGFDDFEDAFDDDEVEVGFQEIIDAEEQVGRAGLDDDRLSDEFDAEGWPS